VRRAEAPAPVKTRRYLLFEAGGFRCGLDVRILREVADGPGTAPAASGPRSYLGSIPVQGGTLPTVDLVALFEGPETGRAAGKVVVLEAEGRRLGLLVERTLEIAELPEDTFRAMPALASRLLPGTVRAVAWQEGAPVFLLDGESLGPLLQTAAGDL
jgi:chemotaxis signal transduction protein